jgi:hypothetical protein
MGLPELGSSGITGIYGANAAIKAVLPLIPPATYGVQHVDPSATPMQYEPKAKGKLPLWSFAYKVKAFLN